MLAVNLPQMFVGAKLSKHVLIADLELFEVLRLHGPLIVMLDPAIDLFDPAQFIVTEDPEPKVPILGPRQRRKSIERVPGINIAVHKIADTGQKIARYDRGLPVSQGWESIVPNNGPVPIDQFVQRMKTLDRGIGEMKLVRVLKKAGVKEVIRIKEC